MGLHRVASDWKSLRTADLRRNQDEEQADSDTSKP